MATIQHKDLPESVLHEPKGASTASAGDVYVSDGAGSGSWATVDAIGSGAAAAGQLLVADGSGGTTFKTELAYGEMDIIANSTGQALTAASDGTLYTNADYVQVTTGLVAGELSGVTYSSSTLIAPVTGEYNLSLWLNVTASVNNILVGLKFAVNGTIPTAGTVPTLRRKIGTGADVGALSGAKLVSLTAGDAVSIWTASDSNATVTFTDGVVELYLLKA
jgi:hypothetical protein